MAQTTQLKAAKKFNPGYFIREQLANHQWSMEGLAIKMNISEYQLNKILNECKPIKFEIARLLGEIFETSSQYWINIDKEFRSWIEQKKTLNHSN